MTTRLDTGPSPIWLRYGTPFLVDLGISEQMTSLVWLAGPISGLVAQPLIGASAPRCCGAGASDYQRAQVPFPTRLSLTSAGGSGLLAQLLSYLSLLLVFPILEKSRPFSSISSTLVKETGTPRGTKLQVATAPSRATNTDLPLMQAKNTSIGVAIFAFFLLDFALNGLQASLRNLLLDVTPAEQLNQANAWHGRMNHAGSIIGNGVGASINVPF